MGLRFDGTAEVSSPDLSLTEKAYLCLEELITTVALPPGSVLGERDIVQRIGIGRTPIREALQRLARDNLVVVLPRRGVLVCTIDLRTQLSLVETRRVLEQLITRLAAEQATCDERAEFATLAAAMRRAADACDDLAFMRLDRLLNRLLADASRNEFAVRSIKALSGLSRRFWYQHYKKAADLPLAANLHADVSEAVAKGESDAAVAASERLLNYIEAFTRKVFDG